MLVQSVIVSLVLTVCNDQGLGNDKCDIIKPESWEATTLVEAQHDCMQNMKMLALEVMEQDDHLYVLDAQCKQEPSFIVKK